jgi:hypothetical protein
MKLLNSFAQKKYILLIVLNFSFVFLLSNCTGSPNPNSPETINTTKTFVIPSATPRPIVNTEVNDEKVEATKIKTHNSTNVIRFNETETPEATLTQRIPEEWKAWPIIPQNVSGSLREIYENGLEKGNNPNAFSILGDCHSLPEVFLGIYDQDPQTVQKLDVHLQETVHQFQGSFDRYSPTVALGTTEGALLWAGWNENQEGFCNSNEPPLNCELRYHKPSIAFIRVGTHWEDRNEKYLRTIIEQLMENGTVPIIVTKADNRELDERVNENLAKLAVEYELPIWNYWASVQELPNKGLNEEDDMYLSDAAYEIAQLDGLIVLDFIYRELH